MRTLRYLALSAALAGCHFGNSAEKFEPAIKPSGIWLSIDTAKRRDPDPWRTAGDRQLVDSRVLTDTHPDPDAPASRSATPGSAGPGSNRSISSFRQSTPDLGAARAGAAPHPVSPGTERVDDQAGAGGLRHCGRRGRAMIAGAGFLLRRSRLGSESADTTFVDRARIGTARFRNVSRSVRGGLSPDRSRRARHGPPLRQSTARDAEGRWTPDRPQALSYARMGDSLVLVAVAWVVPIDGGPEPAGDRRHRRALARAQPVRSSRRETSSATICVPPSGVARDRRRDAARLGRARERCRSVRARQLAAAVLPARPGHAARADRGGGESTRSRGRHRGILRGAVRPSRGAQRSRWRTCWSDTPAKSASGWPARPRGQRARRRRPRVARSAMGPSLKETEP